MTRPWKAFFRSSTILLPLIVGGPLSRSAAAPPSALIILTAEENGRISPPEFDCRDVIHGYIRLAQRQVGEELGMLSTWPCGCDALTMSFR